MNIFLARNNIQAGPYSLEQVNQMFATHQIEMTDLMWHEGMENWRTVGEMTGNQPFYRPVFNVVSEQNPIAQTNDEDYIINNRPEDFDKKPNENDNADSIWDKYNNTNPHKNDKIEKVTLVKLGKNTQGIDISKARKQIDLASIGSRVIAKLIDLFLLFLPTLILFITLSNSPSFEKILKLAESNQNYTQFSGQMNDLLASAVPSHILLITNLLFWGIIFVQSYLLVKRGQTVGKIMMRIRVLDIDSNAIPRFGMLLFVRVSIFIMAMLLIMLQLMPLALLLIAVDIIMMFSNANHQSLHDKLAKTYVVRADDTQTTPLELKPE